jgi:hypothetical protein
MSTRGARRALLRCRITGRGSADFGDLRRSDHHRQLVERCSNAHTGTRFDPEFVVASAHVLDECVAPHHDAGRPFPFQAAHRSEPRLEATMVGLNSVVCVLSGVVECQREELSDRSGQRW